MIINHTPSSEPERKFYEFDIKNLDRSQPIESTTIELFRVILRDIDKINEYYAQLDTHGAVVLKSCLITQDEVEDALGFNSNTLKVDFTLK